MFSLDCLVFTSRRVQRVICFKLLLHQDGYAPQTEQQQQQQQRRREPLTNLHPLPLFFQFINICPGHKIGMLSVMECNIMRELKKKKKERGIWFAILKWCFRSFDRCVFACLVEPENQAAPRQESYWLAGASEDSHWQQKWQTHWAVVRVLTMKRKRQGLCLKKKEKSVQCYVTVTVAASLAAKCLAFT